MNEEIYEKAYNYKDSYIRKQRLLSVDTNGDELPYILNEGNITNYNHDEDHSYNHLSNNNDGSRRYSFYFDRYPDMNHVSKDSPQYEYGDQHQMLNPLPSVNTVGGNIYPYNNGVEGNDYYNNMTRQQQQYNQYHNEIIELKMQDIHKPMNYLGNNEEDGSIDGTGMDDYMHHANKTHPNNIIHHHHHHNHIIINNNSNNIWQNNNVDHHNNTTVLPTLEETAFYIINKQEDNIFANNESLYRTPSPLLQPVKQQQYQGDKADNYEDAIHSDSDVDDRSDSYVSVKEDEISNYSDVSLSIDVKIKDEALINALTDYLPKILDGVNEKGINTLRKRKRNILYGRNKKKKTGDAYKHKGSSVSSFSPVRNNTAKASSKSPTSKSHISKSPTSRLKSIQAKDGHNDANMPFKIKLNTNSSPRVMSEEEYYGREEKITYPIKYLSLPSTPFQAQHNIYATKTSFNAMPHSSSTILPLPSLLETPSAIENSNFVNNEGDEMKKMVGQLSAYERMVKVHRYWEKKKRRKWSKKISYDCRKRVADNRLRIKGRFVKREQALNLLGMGADEECDNEIIRKMLEGKEYSGNDAFYYRLKNGEVEPFGENVSDRSEINSLDREEQLKNIETMKEIEEKTNMPNINHEEGILKKKRDPIFRITRVDRANIAQ